MGGYASQFDLISSEYGWTDEQIGELPLVRFQQVVTAIAVRKHAESREQNYRFSWLARSISQFIAGGYLTDGKSENKAVNWAQSIAYDEVEAAMLKAKQDAPPAPVAQEPARGSYEKLMGFLAQKRD